VEGSGGEEGKEEEYMSQNLPNNEEKSRTSLHSLHLNFKRQKLLKITGREVSSVVFDVWDKFDFLE
jgi:hypothetical protein